LGDERTAAAIARLDHGPSRARLECERAVVAALDTSCRTPVGASSEIAGEEIFAFAYVGLPDGSEWITHSVEGNAADPAATGRLLAERMLAAGAGHLLKQAETWP
jgi:hydroxymethylbilane synthase